jgi:hypothetical protein
MAIQTTTMKNTLATSYGASATHGAIYTTAGTGTAGTEVTGGTYARKPLTWSAAANGVITATATFDVPAGVTVRGGGVHSALTAGTYLDGGAVTDQNFATAGQYTLTFQYTQS